MCTARDAGEASLLGLSVVTFSLSPPVIKKEREPPGVSSDGDTNRSLPPQSPITSHRPHLRVAITVGGREHVGTSGRYQHSGHKGLQGRVGGSMWSSLSVFSWITFGFRDWFSLAKLHKSKSSKHKKCLCDIAFQFSSCWNLIWGKVGLLFCPLTLPWSLSYSANCPTSDCLTVPKPLTRDCICHHAHMESVNSFYHVPSCATCRT